MAWLVRFSTIFTADADPHADPHDNHHDHDHDPHDNDHDNDTDGPAAAPNRPDIELFFSQLWDLGTTGIHRAPDGEIVTGFETESGARSAARRMAARHPGVVGAAAIESAPPIDRWRQGDGARTLTVATDRFHFDMEIDAAGVFGHGAHPTTLLAMNLLLSDGGPGRRVLDVGTGTGVLAIAAALAGATEVVAIDVDRRAVSVAADNAARNQVAVTATSMTIAELLDSIDSATPGSRFDTVVANVLLPVHRDLVSDIRRSLGPGGRLITAGYLLEQAQEVTDLYCSPSAGGGDRRDPSDRGMIVEDHRSAEGWACHRFSARR